MLRHTLAVSLTASLVMLSSAEALANTLPKTAKHFESEDIFNLELAGSPKVSPDGKQVVYVRQSNDIMTDGTNSNIWIVDVNGKKHRPLFSGKKQFYAPVWSPSGDRLAYISNTDGRTQLYVRWMDTGQTALLTNVQSSIRNISWSPNGEHIAFTMSVKELGQPLTVKMPKKPKGAKWSPKVTYVTKAKYQADGAGILEPAYTHIFVVPALGGTPRQLTSDNYNHSGSLAWGKDGQSIYFSANRSDNWEYESRESDIFSVNMNGDIKQITSKPGTESSPKVSPDGKYIAYISTDNKKLAYRNRHLMIKSLSGNMQTNLSKDIDNSLSNIHWNNKSSGLYYQMAERGMITIGFTNLKSEHSKLVEGLGGSTLGRPYTFASFDVNNNVLAYTKGKTDRPADIYTNKQGVNTQVTYLNEDILGHKVLGKVSEIIYKSSIDGEEIQGWYITPPDFDPKKKYPLILEIHGGPHLSYGPHFTAELQRFAAEGYVVFYDNHRGSTSYGERFALLLQNKYSSKYDFADHMSGVDAMIDKGFIDQDKLYIAGGSAGGIASAYAIGLTDRFKAAAVAKPVINWISKVLTADSYLGQIPNQFPGMPWDNFEHYWKRSPLSLVGNVTTPTMLITGEADRRTPTSETEQFYQALKLRKIETIMVRVPGSPHGIAGKPSRMIAKIENILAWFNTH
ncbi:prolyl oligopeptidase family serine peptidase [Psychrosphaera saromensis]